MAEQLLRAQSQEQLNNKHYDRLERGCKKTPLTEKSPRP